MIPTDFNKAGFNVVTNWYTKGNSNSKQFQVHFEDHQMEIDRADGKMWPRRHIGVPTLTYEGHDTVPSFLEPEPESQRALVLPVGSVHSGLSDSGG